MDKKWNQTQKKIRKGGTRQNGKQLHSQKFSWDSRKAEAQDEVSADQSGKSRGGGWSRVGLRPTLSVH